MPKVRRLASVNRLGWGRSICCKSSWTQVGGRPSVSRGRQRRQGRKPALSASVAEGKYRRFRASAVLAGQDGRQKIPVVRTATKKIPSKLGSRSRRARSITRREGTC